MAKNTLNRRQFLLLPRLSLYRSALGRVLWDQYMRSELVATMGSPTLCGVDHLFDMFQHGRTYLIVRGEQFDDVRLTLGFDTWAEAEDVRELLVAMGL
jgi:hypothetical protein